MFRKLADKAIARLNRLFVPSTETLSQIERSLEEIQRKLAPLSALEQRLDLLRRFLVLKEVAPELLASFDIKLPITDGVVDFLSSPYAENIKYVGQIQNWYVEEAERLLWFMSERQPPLTYDDMARGLSACAEQNTPHRFACYHSLTNLYWKFRPFEPRLRTLLARVEAEPQAWEKMHKNYWPKHVVSLLAFGEKDKAKTILKTALKRNGPAYFDLYLPAAELAVACGNRFVKFDKATRVYQAFRQSEEEGAFARLIEGRRVAVVGNGPQEIGTGNGKKIDDYDVVIRFNDFAKTIENQKDYGRKTDVWVRWAGILSPTPKALIKKISLYFAIENLWHEQLDYGMTERLCGQIDDGQRVAALPEDIYLRIRRLVHRPSSGFSIICLVKSLNPEFSADDVFGFSFKEDTAAAAVHMDGQIDKRLNTVHNLAFEKQVLREVIFANQPF